MYLVAEYGVGKDKEISISNNILVFSDRISAWKSHLSFENDILYRFLWNEANWKNFEQWQEYLGLIPSALRVLAGEGPYKVKIGKTLNSEALLEDADCTKACLYLSFVLLSASLGYELTGIGGLDSVGAMLIAIFSFKEGKESFEKARGEGFGCRPSVE